ncbi:MAG: 6-phosphofructokinase, partial [uncultured Rubrobacteraceae bacterium]
EDSGVDERRGRARHERGRAGRGADGLFPGLGGLRGQGRVQGALGGQDLPDGPPGARRHSPPGRHDPRHRAVQGVRHPRGAASGRREAGGGRHRRPGRHRRQREPYRCSEARGARDDGRRRSGLHRQRRERDGGGHRGGHRAQHGAAGHRPPQGYGKLAPQGARGRGHGEGLRVPGAHERHRGRGRGGGGPGVRAAARGAAAPHAEGLRAGQVALHRRSRGGGAAPGRGDPRVHQRHRGHLRIAADGRRAYPAGRYTHRLRPHPGEPPGDRGRGRPRRRGRGHDGRDPRRPGRARPAAGGRGEQAGARSRGLQDGRGPRRAAGV